MGFFRTACESAGHCFAVIPSALQAPVEGSASRPYHSSLWDPSFGLLKAFLSPQLLLSKLFLTAY